MDHPTLPRWERLGLAYFGRIGLQLVVGTLGLVGLGVAFCIPFWIILTFHPTGPWSGLVIFGGWSVLGGLGGMVLGGLWRLSGLDDETETEEDR